MKSFRAEFIHNKFILIVFASFITNSKKKGVWAKITFAKVPERSGYVQKNTEFQLSSIKNQKNKNQT